MNNQSKTYYIWIVLIIVAVGFVLWMGYSRDGDKEVNAEGWFRGGENAAAVLVEYSDFQCPACAGWHPYLKQFESDYGDNIKVVYKHFPLPQHENADITARASEAAGVQGKFWEMHDILFENQSEWESLADPNDTLVGYATDIGLNVEQFTTDIDSSAVNAIVQKDLTEGRTFGVSYTPYLVLNGEVFDNAQGPDGLKAAIEAVLVVGGGEKGSDAGTSTDMTTTNASTSNAGTPPAVPDSY